MQTPLSSDKSLTPNDQTQTAVEINDMTIAQQTMLNQESALEFEPKSSKIVKHRIIKNIKLAQSPIEKADDDLLGSPYFKRPISQTTTQRQEEAKREAQEAEELFRQYELEFLQEEERRTLEAMDKQLKQQRIDSRRFSLDSENDLS